jgi:hypothetical protein
VGVIAGSAVVSVGTLASPALAAGGPVSPVPQSGTPHLLTTGTGAVDQIRQLVQCGSTMYAVGSFTTIKRQSTSYQRGNVFSFSATAPFKVTNWNPGVNGVVNSITFSNGNCSNAYIGGHFSTVGGVAEKNIAEVNTTTGAPVAAFKHSASAMVETVLAVSNHIIVGGLFTSINSSSADPYLVSLNPVTGADDGFVHLNISGNYQFPGVAANATRTYNQQLSHSGRLDLVEGDFTSVGGDQREQVFMMDLSGKAATVTGWTSPEFDGSAGESDPADPNSAGYPYECATVEPFYIQAAAWSPDDTTVYLAATGYHPNGYPTGDTPRQGLCDAESAFPATQESVLHEWVNYTGCDSLYSTAADASAVYIGGHERFADNPNGCDFLNTGGIAAPGMAGLDPGSGDLLLNQAGTALYVRSRGLGADDELVTSAGLWIASDNQLGSQMCGNVQNLAGICFLPYTN